VSVSRYANSPSMMGTRSQPYIFTLYYLLVPVRRWVSSMLDLGEIASGIVIVCVALPACRSLRALALVDMDTFGGPL
jgi:hypothetical protein